MMKINKTGNNYSPLVNKMAQAQFTGTPGQTETQQQQLLNDLKDVVIKLRNLAENHEVLRNILPNDSADRWACYHPLSDAFENTKSLYEWLSGSEQEIGLWYRPDEKPE